MWNYCRCIENSFNVSLLSYLRANVSFFNDKYLNTIIIHIMVPIIYILLYLYIIHIISSVNYFIHTNTINRQYCFHDITQNIIK